jgi:hypothetical protein
MTPGAKGGRPAIAHNKLDQAAACESMPGVGGSVSGVHDARTSICASEPSASISPKPSERTTVTLPLPAV